MLLSMNSMNVRRMWQKLMFYLLLFVGCFSLVVGLLALSGYTFSVIEIEREDVRVVLSLLRKSRDAPETGTYAITFFSVLALVIIVQQITKISTIEGQLKLTYGEYHFKSFAPSLSFRSSLSSPTKPTSPTKPKRRRTKAVLESPVLSRTWRLPLNAILERLRLTIASKRFSKRENASAGKRTNNKRRALAMTPCERILRRMVLKNRLQSSKIISTAHASSQNQRQRFTELTKMAIERMERIFEIIVCELKDAETPIRVTSEQRHNPSRKGHSVNRSSPSTSSTIHAEQIFVRLPQRQSNDPSIITVEYDPSLTVRALKEAICKKSGIPMQCLEKNGHVRLHFGGKSLSDDGSTLLQCGVSARVTIDAQLRLHGGSGVTATQTRLDRVLRQPPPQMPEQTQLDRVLEQPPPQMPEQSAPSNQMDEQQVELMTEVAKFIHKSVQGCAEALGALKNQSLLPKPALFSLEKVANVLETLKQGIHRCPHLNNSCVWESIRSTYSHRVEKVYSDGRIATSKKNDTSDLINAVVSIAKMHAERFAEPIDRGKRRI